MLWICILFGVANVAADIFQCWPVNRSWSGASVAGECFHVAAFYQIVLVINATLEAIILLIPIPMLWKLQLPLRQRVGLVVTFSVGVL